MVRRTKHWVWIFVIATTVACGFRQLTLPPGPDPDSTAAEAAQRRDSIGRVFLAWEDSIRRERQRERFETALLVDSLASAQADTLLHLLGALDTTRTDLAGAAASLEESRSLVRRIRAQLARSQVDSAAFVGTMLESLDKVLHVVSVPQLANLAWNYPDTVMLRRRYRVTLLLGPRRETVLLRQELLDSLPEASRQDTIMIGRVQYVRRMEARLYGSGLEIDTITPTTQKISDTETTQWRWNIQANTCREEFNFSLGCGERELTLTLHGLVDVDGRETASRPQLYAAIVQIRTTRGQQLAGFVYTNWTWLLGGSGVALLAMFRKKLREGWKRFGHWSRKRRRKRSLDDFEVRDE